MEHDKRASIVTTAAVLLLGLLGCPSTASALTQGETDCCFLVMSPEVDKYVQKHIKKVNKCTLKMNESGNPAGEKCDDGFDATTGGTDFVIDKFREKSLKKMKKKCMKKLDLDEAEFNAAGPIPSPCPCNANQGVLSLQGQMECWLELMPSGADTSVCNITPSKRNANRGADSPPGQAGFCP